ESNGMSTSVSQVVKPTEVKAETTTSAFWRGVKPRRGFSCAITSRSTTTLTNTEPSADTLSFPERMKKNLKHYILPSSRNGCPSVQPRRMPSSASLKLYGASIE